MPAPPGDVMWAARRGLMPSNYENISRVLAAMEIINPDGSASLYQG